MLDKLENSVIVVAHPDDEILWFSSLLKKVDHILFCFSDELFDPEFGARRRKMVADFPLRNTSTINLAAMGYWRPQSFVNPRFNKYGIEIVGSDPLYSEHLRKYKENYHDMRERLAAVLSHYRTVFTHNPWGEYGHEEHVQVHRVICELQEKAGYDIWYSGYCSTRTVGMINQSSCVADNMTLQTDRTTAEKFMEIYKQEGCWTWFPEWHWPIQETFFKQGITSYPDPDKGSLVNLNLIVLAPVSQETSGLLLRVYRRLKTLAKAVVVRVAHTL